jgi:hypothetical protein
MAEIAPRFNPNSGTKINNAVAQQNHVADGEAIEQHFSLPYTFNSLFLKN